MMLRHDDVFKICACQDLQFSIQYPRSMWLVPKLGRSSVFDFFTSPSYGRLWEILVPMRNSANWMPLEMILSCRSLRAYSNVLAPRRSRPTEKDKVSSTFFFSPHLAGEIYLPPSSTDGTKFCCGSLLHFLVAEHSTLTGSSARRLLRNRHLGVSNAYRRTMKIFGLPLHRRLAS
ncbi:hypothetical protein LshimejAT787_0112840 [Lyophyllum shimeji]|uniref:Uncharacterized protein n=1 Tax=Lyophyllum shimeji TaxID=47721 RepID=A0A9P3PE91_LYOSH|nr:hypothetical protein LshimejAT787_0112840 [Lyophyllum shimeji]